MPDVLDVFLPELERPQHGFYYGSYNRDDAMVCSQPATEVVEVHRIVLSYFLFFQSVGTAHEQRRESSTRRESSSY